MKKKEFVTDVADFTGLSTHVVKQVLCAAGFLAGDALGDGETVPVPGFGKFIPAPVILVELAPETGRTMRRSEQQMFFQPGKAFGAWVKAGLAEDPESIYS